MLALSQGTSSTRHVRSPDRAICVRFESRPRAPAGDLERERRRVLLIVETCRDAAPASPSCERGHLPFRQFVRVFTTATGVGA